MDEDVGANANVSYSFSNPTGVNSAFRIDRFSGSLFTREPLDRERVAQYSLQVRAVDNAPIGAKLTGEALVEITILDENDNRPHFSRRTYDVQVSEDIDTADRPVIAEIHATDADEGLNSRVRYSITGANTYTYTDANSNTNTHAYSNTDANTDTYTDAHSNTNTHAYSNTDTYSNAHAYSNSYTNTNSDTNAYSDTNTYTHTYSNTDANTNT